MSDLLKKVNGKKKSNVNVPSQSNDLEGLSTVNTVFKQTTNLEVGEHQTVLKSITEGNSNAGSHKLTFVFKDVKSNLCAIETLSFGSIDTHRSAYERLKYLVSDKMNHEIVLPVNPSMGITEPTKTTVSDCIDAVDTLFNEIITKAKNNGEAYAIKSELLKPELGADDTEGLSAEEISEMEDEIQEQYLIELKSDLKSKYDEARDNGFQIYRPLNSKISFAIGVDSEDLAKIMPWANCLFKIAINKSFVIRIKQAGRYKNIVSIHSKSI